MNEPVVYRVFNNHRLTSDIYVLSSQVKIKHLFLSLDILKPLIWDSSLVTLGYFLRRLLSSRRHLNVPLAFKLQLLRDATVTVLKSGQLLSDPSLVNFRLTNSIFLSSSPCLNQPPARLLSKLASNPSRILFPRVSSTHTHKHTHPYSRVLFIALVVVTRSPEHSDRFEMFGIGMAMNMKRGAIKAGKH